MTSQTGADEIKVRFYGAKESLFDGTYQYPRVSVVNAVTGDTTAPNGTATPNGGPASVGGNTGLLLVALLGSIALFLSS